MIFSEFNLLSPLHLSSSDWAEVCISVYLCPLSLNFLRFINVKHQVVRLAPHCIIDDFLLI